jgi:hypothetical protein
MGVPSSATAPARAARRCRRPGRHRGSPSMRAGAGTSSQSSIAGNRSTVRSGSAASGSLDQTGVCMCTRIRLPCPARCSGISNRFRKSNPSRATTNRSPARWAAN